MFNRYFILYGRNHIWEVVELGKYDTIQSLLIAIEYYIRLGYRFFEIEVIEK
ncbi:MAG: hypothetical protein QXT64_06995 [Desulfurococcaceae archaeon]